MNKKHSKLFELWVEEHGPGLLHYLRSMLSRPEDAEDIWQETFMKVHQSMHLYRDRGGQEKAWLYKIAKNRLVDHYRFYSKRPNLVPIEVDHIMTEEEPVSQLSQEEMKLRFEAAIKDLPEPQREVYLLRQRSDLSFKDIAKMLDLPMTKVVGRMNQAMKKLKDVLERMES